MRLFDNPNAAVLKHLQTHPGRDPEAVRCDMCGRFRRCRVNHDLHMTLCSRKCRETAEASVLENKWHEIDCEVRDILAISSEDNNLTDAQYDRLEVLASQRGAVDTALARLRRKRKS